ncbi:MAG: ATP-binding cassette domain-containing protein, partial [Perlucidibaca sp.]
MTDASPLLSLQGIRWVHDGRAVLDGVDLTLRRGEILTIIGPNGAGKTCLIRIALGLMPASSGDRRLAPGLRIGYLPQKLRLNTYLPLTVADFLALPDAGHGNAGTPWWRRRPQPYRRSEILAALAEVGAEHLLMQPAQALSGGGPPPVGGAPPPPGPPDPR